MKLPLTGMRLGALFLLAACAGTANSPLAAQTAPARVLVVTATQGFRHTDGIDAAKAFLANAGAEDLRFDVTENLEDINAANLAGYDVLFLNNSTLRIAPLDPSDSASVAATRSGRRPIANPITAQQREAIRDFVRSGKGLAVAHSGVDAMYGWDEYREMVGGGLFKEHPWTQEVQVNVEDRSNPATAHLGESFRLRDEIYVLDHNPRPSSHVLLSLDMPSTGAAAGSADHPLSWIRRHGEGRVFVTVLGHFGDVWNHPGYRQHVLQGIRIAAGRLPADFNP